MNAQPKPPADNGRFVSRGAAHLSIRAVDAPRDFHFLLLRGMTMLAFSSAVEPLRIANQLTGRCLYRWFLQSEDGQPVRCSNGIAIPVDSAIATVPREDTAFICSGVDGYLAASPRALAWLRDHARHGGTVGGLCTGAFSLARAGLLERSGFTIHWEVHPTFTEHFPDLAIADALYVQHKRVLTCGGGNAAVDMMTALIAADHGAALAQMVSDMCLHGRSRIADDRQRVSLAATYQTRHPVLLRIIRQMVEERADEFSLAGILDAEKISRRQVERLFNDHIGTSPAKFLRRIRLDRAHGLMSETDMTLTEIAFASGFNSLAAFRKAWSARHGALPRYRHRT
ncbi:GlxA family transcriptional regulator [Falsirhodobacter xinxiangensis]|uniref:GlxA family transcriptional regulator n=1 Tax=Falsirhodobacter xinxiangensis TaxID=2530049 RepID=UPI0010A9A8CE|nr:GlxA family transcriptional regulator [Rhodobacter xinxiangensis]